MSELDGYSGAIFVENDRLTILVGRINENGAIEVKKVMPITFDMIYDAAETMIKNEKDEDLREFVLEEYFLAATGLRGLANRLCELKTLYGKTE